MAEERPTVQDTASSLDDVALLGEALVDIFPEREALGGAPFNVARNLAALGAHPLMVTRLGCDHWGDAIAAEFARLGMDMRGVQRDPDRATGTASVLMRGPTHSFEIGSARAWDRIDANVAAEAVRSGRPRIVYFGTLAQRSDVSRAAIRTALEATPALRFLDLNLRDGPDNRTLAAESLARAQIVKVNDEELECLRDWFVDPQTAAAQPLPEHDAVRALMSRFDLDRLVVTRGAAGWACYSVHEPVLLEGRSRVTQVLDTVGAGDAFASVLLLGEVRGWPLPTTLQRAGEFAASVCTIRGAFDSSAGIYDAARATWNE